MANEEAEGTNESNWTEVCENLRSEIGEAAFQSWIKPMTVRSVVGGAARLSVPTRFMRDWAVAHYLDKLGSLWNAIDASVHTVEVLIQPELSLQEGVKKTSVAAAAEAATSAAVSMASTESRRPFESGTSEISAPLDARFSFDNFVVGKPNEFATSNEILPSNDPTGLTSGKSDLSSTF